MDLDIKIIILEYNGKVQQKTFRDWLVYVDNFFAYKPMTDDRWTQGDHSDSIFHGYLAVWWAELQ